MRVFTTISLLLGLLAMSLLLGCSGGSSAARTRASSAAITFTWPDRTATTRLIPQATESIKVTLAGPDSYLKEQIVNRPSYIPQPTTSTVEFDSVPVGELIMTATAYPEYDAGGTPLATGFAPITGVAGAVVTKKVIMGSTIDHLAISPAALILPVDGRKTLVFSALSADDEVVLTSYSQIEWSSSDPSLVQVSDSGDVLARAIGSAIVTVRDVESGKIGQLTVTVKSPAAMVERLDIAPAVVSIAIGQRLQLSATARDIDGNLLAVPTGNYTWSTSDATLATVDAATGMVTGVKDGTLTVMVKEQVSGKSKTVNVTVKDYALLSYTADATWMENAKKTWAPSSPSDLVVDKDGNVYVLDNNRIYKFDKSGNSLDTFGSYGEGAGQFKNASDLLIDAIGLVYVLDSYGRVERFYSNGTYRDEIKIPFDGEEYSYDRIHSFAIDRSGNIYVADETDIKKFSSRGVLLATWNMLDSAAGDYRYPTDLTIDKNGDLLANDAYYNQVYRISTSNGMILDQFTIPDGDYYYYASYEPSIATDPDGNIFVVDNPNYCFRQYTPEGDLTNTVGSYGAIEGKFRNPMGIAVAKTGEVYVTDITNKKITKFLPVLTPGSGAEVVVQ